MNMTVLPMLAVGILMNFIAVVFVLVSVVLVLVILIQKGRGGGLSAAFGGGMAGSLLGSKTGDFLTWVTIVLVGVFLLLAVVLAKFYKPSNDFGAQGAATTTSQPGATSSAPTTQPATPATPGAAGAGTESVPTEAAPATAPSTTESGTTPAAEPNANGG
jgi:preprotein translocase subunit SecG